MGFLSKIKTNLSHMLKYMKHGGVVYMNVSFTQPDKRFAGKKVFISGGSSGIGLEMAKEYLAEGADVLITGRSRQHLKEAETKLQSAHLHTMVWDIDDVDSIEAKMKEAISIMGAFDIFVNNAGVGIKYVSWDKYDREVYDSVHKTNERALFFMSQAQGKYFVVNKIQGKILNIISIAGLMPLFDPYAVSKWGAACSTVGLAKALAPYGINVNGIAPGTVMTNIEDWYKGRSIEDNAFYAAQPTKRFTMKEEIASLALFLTSGAANNIVGQIVAVDGGRCLH